MRSSLVWVRAGGAAGLVVASIAGGAAACSPTPTFSEVGGTTGPSSSSGGLGGAGGLGGGVTSASGGATSSSTTAGGGTSSTAASTTATSASAAASSSGCTAKTCAQQGAACGSISDGCTGTLQCGGCASNQTCYKNQCCTPLGCGPQICGIFDDTCGGMTACSDCPEGQGCGTGGVPNRCSPVTTTSCTGSCPAGQSPLATVTNVDCGGGTCADPTSETICVVDGANQMSGCGVPCPTGWQMVGYYLTCSCPSDQNYFVCAK